MVSTPVSMPLATTGPVSAATIAKVTRRLLPFLLLMYVLALLDRANVGFEEGVSARHQRQRRGLCFRRQHLLPGLCRSRGPVQSESCTRSARALGCAGSW